MEARQTGGAACSTEVGVLYSPYRRIRVDKYVSSWCSYNSGSVAGWSRHLCYSRCSYTVTLKIITAVDPVPMWLVCVHRTGELCNSANRRSGTAHRWCVSAAACVERWPGTGAATTCRWFAVVGHDERHRMGADGRRVNVPGHVVASLGSSRRIRRRTPFPAIAVMADRHADPRRECCTSTASAARWRPSRGGG